MDLMLFMSFWFCPTGQGKTVQPITAGLDVLKMQDELILNKKKLNKSEDEKTGILFKTNCACCIPFI